MTDDLISRQAALEHLKMRLYETAMNNLDLAGVFSEMADHRVGTWINELPTAEKNDEEAYEAGYTAAQMELKDAYKPRKGEWIPVVDGHYIIWECSECHVESEAWTDFCPICGSRNIEEMDEDGGER